MLECRLLAELRHPNIVPYKDSFEHSGFLYIAMGYCEGGDLYTRLRRQTGFPLEERQLIEWFVQICIALQIPEMPNQYSPEMIDLMRALLHQRPEKRPSARRILRNPFIRKHIILFLESTKYRYEKTVPNKSAKPHAITHELSEETPAPLVPSQFPENVPKVQKKKKRRNLVKKNENDNEFAAGLPPIPIVQDRQLRPQCTTNVPIPSIEMSSSNRVRTHEICNLTEHPSPIKRNLVINGFSPTMATEKECPASAPCENKPLSKEDERNLPEWANHSPLSNLDVPLPPTRMNARERRRERRRLSEQADAQSKSAELVRQIVLVQRPHTSHETNDSARVIFHTEHESHSLDGTQSQDKFTSRVNVFSSSNLLDNPEQKCPCSDEKAGTNQSPDLGYASPDNLPSPLSVRVSSEKVSSYGPIKDAMNLTPLSLPGSPASVLAPSEESGKSRKDRAHMLTGDSDVDGLAECMRHTLTISGLPNSCMAASFQSGDSKRISGENSNASPNHCQTNDLVDNDAADVSDRSCLSNRTDSTDESGPKEPADETISRTSRLKQRFDVLRKECINDVGLRDLNKVYDILEQDLTSDQQELLLKRLLGEDIYSRYMGKIWQLKIFEQHMFNQPR